MPILLLVVGALMAYAIAYLIGIHQLTWRAMLALTPEPTDEWMEANRYAIHAEMWRLLRTPRWAFLRPGVIVVMFVRSPR